MAFSEFGPQVNLAFFDIDSLNKAQAEIILLTDSLQRVNERIQNGETGLQPIADQLQIEIAELEQAVQDLQAGRTRVDQVMAEGSAGTISFMDSATLFPFPLNPMADQSVFFITIGEDQDTIGVMYERRVWDTLDVVRIDAKNIQVMFHSYDSVKVICDSVCLESSNETILEIYF